MQVWSATLNLVRTSSGRGKLLVFDTLGADRQSPKTRNPRSFPTLKPYALKDTAVARVFA